MISLFGTMYGLLSPWWLVLFPIGAAVLVYAYLRRGQGERTLVPTLLILRKLKRTSLARRKFIPPRRFFYELLVLLLLVTGGAGLYREGRGQKIAVLIDNSFSMGALQDENDPSSTLLEAALHQAQTAIERRSGATGFQIFVSSPSFRALSTEFEPANKALQRMDQIHPEFASDNLDAALGRVGLDVPADKVLVFSDKKLSSASGSTLESRLAAQKISFVSVSSSSQRLQNLALGSIALQRSTLNSDQTALKVAVHSFAEAEAPLLVSLEGLDGANGKLFAVGRRQLRLGPGTVETVYFENIPRQAVAFRVFLVSTAKNALKDDDSAWISLEASGGKALLVSDFSPEPLGLRKVPTLDFDSVSSVKFDTCCGAGSNFWTAGPVPSLIVFHRTTPTVLPPANSLFIVPPQDNRLFPMQAAVDAPEITRWLSSHPVNSYLNFPALTLKSVTPFQPQSWLEPLLSTTSGNILSAGEKGGHRYVVSGFELLPYEGKNSPLVSVLTLNIFKWLSDFALSSGFQNTWSSIALEPQMIATRYPSGERLLPTDGNSTLLIEQPGLVKLSTPERNDRYVAVRFFDEGESNTLTAEQLTLPAMPASSQSGSEKELWASVLALIVLGFLALELLQDLARGMLGLRKS